MTRTKTRTQEDLLDYLRNRFPHNTICIPLDVICGTCLHFLIDAEGLRDKFTVRIYTTKTGFTLKALGFSKPSKDRLLLVNLTSNLKWGINPFTKGPEYRVELKPDLEALSEMISKIISDVETHFSPPKMKKVSNYCRIKVIHFLGKKSRDYFRRLFGEFNL